MSVHNLRHTPMQPGGVYVGRVSPGSRGRVPADTAGADGIFGNPFAIGRDGDRDTVITKFEAYARRRIERDPAWRDRVRALDGKRLFCWCAPEACHAEVLETIACELAGREAMESEAP